MNLSAKKATRRRSTYLYIVPNSLNDPRIIIFITTRSQTTPGKTIPSVVKHQLKVLVPCEYQLAVPARGGWRERVTESDMFDMCSRVCDMQSVSCILEWDRAASATCRRREAKTIGHRSSYKGHEIEEQRKLDRFRLSHCGVQRADN